MVRCPWAYTRGLPLSLGISTVVLDSGTTFLNHENVESYDKPQKNRARKKITRADLIFSPASRQVYNF